VSFAPPEARLATQLVRERMTRAERPRTPEPMVMDDEASVAAFHIAHPIYQLPVYRLNAEAMSRLLPEEGVVLDLGSGSGQLLAHLARARPDVRAMGTDLAESMLETGRVLLREAGLADRVELVQADMTELSTDISERVDLISTIWALHHLPTQEHLERCLAQIARVRDRTGCAVWIFDFARLRRDATIHALIDLAPDAPQRLQEDGFASVRAAWSEAELRAAMDGAGLSDLRGGRERIMGHVQAYHAAARDAQPSGHAARWTPSELPRESARLVRMLRVGLPSLPS
jgi:ubiquinone/menaquinone biosynthesis C-methylase UbiE